MNKSEFVNQLAGMSAAQKAIIRAMRESPRNRLVTGGQRTVVGNEYAGVSNWQRVNTNAARSLIQRGILIETQDAYGNTVYQLFWNQYMQMTSGVATEESVATWNAELQFNATVRQLLEA